MGMTEKEDRTGIKPGSELRMCEQDRVQWGTPEWIDIDPSWIFRLRGSKLERLETEMNISFSQLFEIEIPNYTMRAKRVLLWLALKGLGITPPYKDFDPYTGDIEGRVVKPEAKPAEDGEGTDAKVDPTKSGDGQSTLPESSPSSDKSADAG